MTPRNRKARGRIFTAYTRGYVRRHFHTVRLLKTHAPLGDFMELPAAVFLNHASWWDPLICLLLAAEFFPARSSFAPIDADALRRYRFLKNLGFFPVKMGSARGAAEFIRTASALLESQANLLWLTPQGKFTDIRARPVALQRGLAHLAGRVGPCVFLPLAIEYSFWEARLPEVLIAFGTPLFTRQLQNSCGADDWAGAIERTLEDTQDALAAAVQRRNGDDWRMLSRGGAGTTPLYDGWRKMTAAFRRETFSTEHSKL